jgi:hypothetical protein
MNTYNPETHVAVPKGELVKLEATRVELYKYLESEGFFPNINTQEYLNKVLKITSLTQNMWMIANKKNWGDI